MGGGPLGPPGPPGPPSCCTFNALRRIVECTQESDTFSHIAGRKVVGDGELRKVGPHIRRPAGGGEAAPCEAAEPAQISPSASTRPTKPAFT